VYKVTVGIRVESRPLNIQEPHFIMKLRHKIQAEGKVI